jgi:hypothetical protein
MLNFHSACLLKISPPAAEACCKNFLPFSWMSKTREKVSARGQGALDLSDSSALPTNPTGPLD